MLPECRVNVQIALKFKFFLKFPRFSKTAPQSPELCSLAYSYKTVIFLSIMGGELLFPYCKFSLTFNRSVGNQELHT